jgi:hypothetical protein
MDELQLEVTAFTDIAHWRWRLTDVHGAFKADHQVALNQSDPAYDAFTNLYDYLRYHAAPDRRLEREVEIIAWLGRWIGEQELGPVGAAIVEHAPVVRVVSQRPQGLSIVLQLGYINDAPLAVQEVSFLCRERQAGGRKTDVGDRLRCWPSSAYRPTLRRWAYAVSGMPSSVSSRRLRKHRGKQSSCA